MYILYTLVWQVSISFLISDSFHTYIPIYPFLSRAPFHVPPPSATIEGCELGSETCSHSNEMCISLTCDDERRYVLRCVFWVGFGVWVWRLAFGVWVWVWIWVWVWVWVWIGFRFGFGMDLLWICLGLDWTEGMEGRRGG